MPAQTAAQAPDAPLAQRIATALHKLGLAMKNQSWRQAQGRGLSPTQGQILSLLASSGPQSGKEIAAALGVSLPTVSASVKTLVGKGLAEKHPDPRHARASLVSLTAPGRDAGAEARSWPDFLAGAVGSMSDAEQAAFYSGLLKMIRSLQEAGQIPTQSMCLTCTHFRPRVHTGPRPHHCALIDAPMADTTLRLECPDHEAASPEQQLVTWRALTQG